MSIARSACVSCACCIESLTLQIQFPECYLNGIEGWELWGSGRGKAEREFVFKGNCASVAKVRGRQ